jgi:tRNA(Ile)-lysidine synthase
MTFALQPLAAGTYIVAVSGGVDSMTLLDLLRQQPQLKLVVAHANHGMRADSDIDQKLVVSFCKSHNITCEVKKLHLGTKTSEEAAREARYKFLRRCRAKHIAQAIITAHHQDDLIETALINLLRGTGWRGLAPFVANSDIVRPLMNVTKQQLAAYATAHAVPWREDSTNTDETYLRNYVRHTLVPLLTKRNGEWRSDFLRLVRDQQSQRRTIEQALTDLLDYVAEFKNNNVTLNRYSWIMLPTQEAYELFQALCRARLGNSLVRELATQALLFIKTARPDKIMPLNNRWQLRAMRSQIIVEPRLSVVS